MSNNDDSFFTENIVNINRKIALILYCANIVPICFVILTHVGVWYVPTMYAILILVYNSFFATICYFFNRTSQRVLQYISMYLGLIAVSMFVFLLGMKGVIVLTVTYAFAPILSCLYYNRKLTIITTILNFFLTILAFWLRSSSVTLVLSGVKSAERWFLENVPGVIVEFIFVFLITEFISRRTYQTFRRIMSLNADMNGAYRRLNEKNLEQFNMNKELQEKNEYIERLNSELNFKNISLNENQHRIIEFIIICLGNFDLFGIPHNYHTSRYVLEICKKLRADGHYTDILTDETISRYSLAALLHDIGKARIPQRIVNKVGKYTREEYEIIKCHPMEGRKMLENLPPVDEGKLNVIAKEMALYHHEKWDGSGYPYGVSGETIPLCARIMAAADVLDALISLRLYKEPVSVDEAMKVFESESGKHFEPCIAEAVVALKEEILIIDRDFKTNEAVKFEDEVARWQKFHPELKVLGKGIK